MLAVCVLPTILCTDDPPNSKKEGFWDNGFLLSWKSKGSAKKGEKVVHHHHHHVHRPKPPPAPSQPVMVRVPAVVHYQTPKHHQPQTALRTSHPPAYHETSHPPAHHEIYQGPDSYSRGHHYGKRHHQSKQRHRPRRAKYPQIRPAKEHLSRKERGHPQQRRDRNRAFRKGGRYGESYGHVSTYHHQGRYGKNRGRKRVVLVVPINENQRPYLEHFSSGLHRKPADNFSSGSEYPSSQEQSHKPPKSYRPNHSPTSHPFSKTKHFVQPPPPGQPQRHRLKLAHYEVTSPLHRQSAVKGYGPPKASDVIQL